MIVKIPLILAICLYVRDVSSASFSKVFVQNGADYPHEYLQYGAPSVSYSPQIARLTAAPVGSVVPYSSNYVPCGLPCIYPGQVASVAPSANIVQYQSPSLPVVVAPRNEHSGYEYSYVVYDDQTGDHKAQRELSDGSVVRGGYSFLQPDGLVRDVQYVADDLQGFNAIVKNYAPAFVSTTKHKHGHQESAPCDEDQQEHITDHKDHQKAHHEPEESHGEHGHDSHHEPSHEDLKTHEHEANHEEHHEEQLEEHHEEHHEPEHHEEPHEQEPEEHHEEHHEPEHHEEPHEPEPEEHLEEHHEPEPHEEHHEEHHEPEHHEEHHEEPHEENHEPEHHEEHHEPEKHEEHHEPEQPEHDENNDAHDHEEHAEPREHGGHEEHHAEVIHEEPHEHHHESHDEPETHETHVNHLAVAENNIDKSNILVSYNDIIRCVQAAINGVNGVAPHNPESPLTYIILNKPC